MGHFGASVRPIPPLKMSAVAIHVLGDYAEHLSVGDRKLPFQLAQLGWGTSGRLYVWFHHVKCLLVAIGVFGGYAEPFPGVWQKGFLGRNWGKGIRIGMIKLWKLTGKSILINPLFGKLACYFIGVLCCSYSWTILPINCMWIAILAKSLRTQQGHPADCISCNSACK